MEKSLDVSDINCLLNGVVYLQEKLAHVNQKLAILEKSLRELLVYPEEWQNFKNGDSDGTKTFSFKLESLNAAAEFFKLLNLREEITQELKEVYKDVFIRENEVGNENPFYGWRV